MKALTETGLVHWLRFSGRLEMGFGILFLTLMPWLFTAVEVIFPLFVFSNAFGVCIFALGATLSAAANKAKEVPFVPVISCGMRFAMMAVEIDAAIRLWGLTTFSYAISLGFICGAIYDGVSAAFTLWVLKQLKYI